MFFVFFWTSHCCQAVCCVKFVTKTQGYWVMFFFSARTLKQFPLELQPAPQLFYFPRGKLARSTIDLTSKLGADLRRGILWKATKTREIEPPHFGGLSSPAKYMGQFWRISPSKLPLVWVGKIMIPEKSARNQITTHPPKDFTGDIRLNPLKWPLFQSWIKAIQPNHLWNIKFWYIWPDQRPSFDKKDMTLANPKWPLQESWWNLAFKSTSGAR